MPYFVIWSHEPCDRVASMTIRLSVKALSLLLPCLAACEAAAPRSHLYEAPNAAQLPLVQQVCGNVGVSHFLVKDRTVWVRERHRTELLKLEHYVSYLPDGHYNCTAIPTQASRLD